MMNQRIYISNQFRLLITLTLLLSTLLSASPAQAQAGTHIVQSGESLSTIAQRYGMTTSELASLNGITNYDHVQLGQKLNVSSSGGASYAPSVASTIHIVQTGDTLSSIAATYGVSTQSIMDANGLPNANFVWVGQRLRISGSGGYATNYSVADVSPGVGTWPGTINGGAKLIEVNLSSQTLTAWNSGILVMQSVISSGTAWTPTVTGRFMIDRKYPSQRMYGPGYDLDGVPWVMYFWDGYAFHGAYWHNNFGMPMSHGCVHLTPGEAQILYNWAGVGTEVYVHY